MVEKKQDSEKKENEKELSSEQKAEDKEKEIEIPKNLEKLVKEIEEMKVVDLAKLVKVLEKKFGVSASAVVAAPAQGAVGAEAESKSAEKSEYNIVLESSGSKKIAVIKVLKKITNKGLKDCKDLVDAADTSPQTVKERVGQEEAEKIKKELEEAGAKVKLA